MLLLLHVPSVNDLMKDAEVLCVLAEPATRVERGTPLFEMRVDLSAAAAQNCSPTFDFRIVANEPGWVRRVDVVRGAVASVGAPLALLSSLPDEPIDGPASRALRVNLGVVLPSFPDDET